MLIVRPLAPTSPGAWTIGANLTLSQGRGLASVIDMEPCFGEGCERLGRIPNSAYGGLDRVFRVRLYAFRPHTAASEGHRNPQPVQADLDLNTLVPSDSPLYLISSGDINDRGEITGQACVVSDGVCTSETPAFLAIPKRGGDPEGALSTAQADDYQGPNVVVPESIRKQVLHGLASVALGPSR